MLGRWGWTEQLVSHLSISLSSGLPGNEGKVFLCWHFLQAIVPFLHKTFLRPNWDVSSTRMPFIFFKCLCSRLSVYHKCLCNIQRQGSVSRVLNIEKEVSRGREETWYLSCFFVFFFLSLWNYSCATVEGFHTLSDLRMHLNVIMLQKISRGSVAPQTDQLPIEQLWEEQSCSLPKGGRISLVQYTLLFFWTGTIWESFLLQRQKAAWFLLTSLKLYLKQLCGVNIICSIIDLVFEGGEENFLETSCKIFCLRKWKTCCSEK